MGVKDLLPRNPVVLLLCGEMEGPLFYSNTHLIQTCTENLSRWTCKHINQQFFIFMRERQKFHRPFK